MQERIQLKQEEIVGDQTVLNDIYPKTNTNSIDDTNSGVPLNTTIDRLWNSINNKLSRIVNSVNGRTGVVVLNAEDVGLGNVDNVSLADIKNWVINRLQEEFNTKRIELFDYLDEVETMINTVWKDDKAYADKPFYARHGARTDSSSDNPHDGRGYIGYIYWDESLGKLDYAFQVLDTIGYADNSIIYNEKVNDIDYRDTGTIGVNIWKYEDALEAYNRLSGNKEEAGLRINRDKLNQHVYFFKGVYGSGDPDDPDALLYLNEPETPETTFPVDIYVDGIKTDYSESRVYSDYGRFKFYGVNYLKQTFRKNDIIICQFSDENYTDIAENFTMFKEKMNPQLLLNNTAVGQVTQIPDQETATGKYEIRFYTIKPNLYVGLKEYTLGNYSNNKTNGFYRKSIGISLLNAYSGYLTHELEDESIIDERLFDIPPKDYDYNGTTYNVSGINVLRPYVLHEPKTRFHTVNGEKYRKHAYIVTPMGSTTNILENKNARNVADDSSMFISTNYSMCIIPGFYGIPYEKSEPRRPSNIVNWPAAVTGEYNDVYDSNDEYRHNISHIGINLEKILVDKGRLAADPLTYAINVSGLRIGTDKTPLSEEWFNGGFDKSLTDINKFHSGGLSVNVGEFLDIGTPSKEYIRFHSADYYNAEGDVNDGITYYEDGKVNVRINRDMGLNSDGANSIAINLSEVEGWFNNENKLFEQSLLGGGLTFVESQEVNQGSNVEWKTIINFLDDSTDTLSYLYFVTSDADGKLNKLVELFGSSIEALEDYASYFKTQLNDNNSEYPNTLAYILNYAKIAIKGKTPTPTDLQIPATSFEFLRTVAKYVREEFSTKCDELIEILEEYNAGQSSETDVPVKYINEFDISPITSYSKSFRTLTCKTLDMIINYTPDSYPNIPKVTKGLAVNRGIGLRMSHYRSADVWTHTDEPETLAVSVFDSIYTTTAPERKEITDIYQNLPPSDEAPTFVPDKFYNKELTYAMLEVRPSDWSTNYYNYYTQETVVGDFVNVNSASIPVWHVNRFYTYDQSTQEYVLQTEPPYDWNDHSYHYYGSDFTNLYDPPEWDPNTFDYYTYDHPSQRYIEYNSPDKPRRWEYIYSTFFYKEDGKYFRVRNANVLPFESGKYYTYGIVEENDGSTTYDYILLTTEPNNWDELTSMYYEATPVALLNAPNFVANRYYQKLGDDNYELLTEIPATWTTNYYAFYEKKTTTRYNKIPQYVAPNFVPDKYYRQSDDGHGNLTYVLLSEQPDNWESRFFDYYTLETKQSTYDKEIDNYVQLELRDPAPTWCENQYYTKQNNEFILQTSKPSDWDENYTKYFTLQKVSKPSIHEVSSYIPVEGIVNRPSFNNDGPFYKQIIAYNLITDKPENWYDSWTIYYLKLDNYEEPDATYNMFYDMNGMEESSIHDMYGGLRYMYTPDGNVSAIGVRINPTDDLCGDSTHIGSEGLKISDENVLGIQLYQTTDYVNPLEITNMHDFVEQEYGRYLFLPCTTLIYPKTSAFPTTGEIDRVYISTGDGSGDFTRYIWNDKTNQYEEMLVFCPTEADKPAIGEPNKVYVVGSVGNITLYTWGHPKNVLFPDSTGSNDISWLDAQDALNAYAATSVARERSYSYEQLKRLDVDHNGSVNASDSSSILLFWSKTFNNGDSGPYTDDIEGWRYFSENNLGIKDPNPEATQYFIFPPDVDESKTYSTTPGLNLRYSESAGLTNKVAAGNYNYRSDENGNYYEGLGVGELFYKDALAVKINDTTATTITSKTPKSELKCKLGGMRFASDGSLAVRINDQSHYSVKNGSGKDILTDGSKGLCIDNDNVLGVKVNESKRDLVIDRDGNLTISDEFKPEYEWSLSSLIIGNDDEDYVAYNGSQDVEIRLGPGLYLSYGDVEEMSEQEKVIMNYTEAIRAFNDMSIRKAVLTIRYVIIDTTLFDDIQNVEVVYYPDFNESDMIEEEDVDEMESIFASVTRGDEVDPEDFLKADVDHNGIVNQDDITIVENFLDSTYQNNARGWYDYCGYELNIWNIEDYYPQNIYDLKDRINTITQSIRDDFEDQDVLSDINKALENDEYPADEVWDTNVDILLSNLSRVVAAMSYADLKQFCIDNSIPLPAATDNDEAVQIVEYIKTYKSIPEFIDIYKSIYSLIPEAGVSVHKYEMLRQKVFANLNILQITQFIRKVGSTKNLVKGLAIVDNVPYPGNAADDGHSEITRADIAVLDGATLPLSDELKQFFDVDKDGNVYELYDRELILKFISGDIEEARAKAALDQEDFIYPNNETGWKLYLDRVCNIYGDEEFEKYMTYLNAPDSLSPFDAPGYFEPYSYADAYSLTKACTNAMTNKRAYNTVLAAYNESVIINTTELSEPWNMNLTQFRTAITEIVNNLSNEELIIFVGPSKYNFKEQEGFPFADRESYTDQEALAVKSFLTTSLLFGTKKCIPLITLVDIYNTYHS